MPLSDFFSQICIVLVNPTDPGNIGAAARAMKTMGLKHLFLVRPKVFPHARASIRAGKALDILANATQIHSLGEILTECKLVFGTSTRTRELHWPCLTPHQAAEKAGGISGQKIAILFGCERSGLANQDLQRCHYQIMIPASSEYNSLNLAAAVQIICYEIRMIFLKQQKSGITKTNNLADVTQLEYFFQHLHEVLLSIDFFRPFRSQQIMNRLRRLFFRTELDETEVKILRGILRSIQRKIVSTSV
jgi:tRNA (cytidine32/uridine32-2'-O)-methyltransferase